MIHIHSIDFAPRPKRCDVRASKKTYERTHEILREEITPVEKHTRHERASIQFKQRGEVA